ncbi:MAG: ECF-type sigma factor [Bryobacteraceae bacterium]
MEPDAGDITVLLQQWGKGDDGVVDKLAPLVYDHLKAVASGYLSRESSGATLQPTGLVHELFLRLLRQKKLDLANRVHFFVFAARMMRRILVDSARARIASKRAADLTPLSLSPDLSWVDPRQPELLDLDHALDELAAEDARKARVVELRIFLGCTAEETADLLDISKATVDRELRYALAWLYDRLEAGCKPS